MKNRIFLTCITGFFVLMMLGTAEATLLDGKNIRIRYLYPNITTDFTAPIDAVVGPGIEANFGFGTPLIDISDTNIYFDFSGGGGSAAFNGFQFIDYMGTIDSFLSVDIAGTNLAFDSSRISFDENNIWVNFQSLASGSDGFVSLDVGAAPVPEPATMFLLGTGLVGVAGAARRKKKNQV